MLEKAIMFFICCVLLCGAALAADLPRDAAFYYPAQRRVVELNRDEVALSDEIRQVFGEAGRPLPLVDGQLARAARERAVFLSGLSHEDSKLEAGRDPKSWLLPFGVGDDRSAAGFATASTPEKLREIFGAWAAGKRGGQWTHLGVGLHKSAAGLVGLVILSYRPIDPAPIPLRMDFRRSLVVEGAARNGSDFLLFLASPDGSVFMQKPTRMAGGQVSGEFKLRYSGTHTLQLVELGSAGPLPVATMPIDIGKASLSWTPPMDALRAAAPESLPQLLPSWLNGLRQHYMLSELSADPRLNEIAARLAAEMAAGGSFAHQSGAEGPRDRIERSGVKFLRFGENLAHGRAIEEMMLKLWSSPSHRYNMLDEGFDIFGCGIASNGNGQWFMVQIFAESAVSTRP